MENLQKIVSVRAISSTQLRIRFDNAVEKVYDAAPILSLPQFQLPRNPVFFQAARVDPGGYGISWNDNIDLSEFELWTHGVEAYASICER